MSDLYNPSGIPYGVPNAQGSATPLAPGKWDVMLPDGSAVLCTVVVEGTPTFARPGIMIEQPGIFGQGGNIAVPEDPDNPGRPAEMFNTGSIAYQVPKSTTTRPFCGCYVDVTLDNGRGEERWLWKEETSSYPNNNYWTCTATVTRDPNPGAEE